MKTVTQLSIVCFIIIFVGLTHGGGWVQTFADEFNNQQTLNLNLWTTAYAFSPAIINSEIEYYIPSAFSFTPTTMKILIEHQPGYTPWTNGNITSVFNYTSGVITTRNKWAQAFGYFAMSARMPYGVGFWPAFWLLPNLPNNPYPWEIDVMEILTEDDVLHTTFHCDYDGKNLRNYGIATSMDSLHDGGFHEYGLQWLPGTLLFYLDKKLVFNWTNECVPTTPEYMLANVAMGGWPKPPNNQTVFPNYLEIDYIRAYSYSDTATLNLGGDVGQGIPYKSATIGTWNAPGPYTNCTHVQTSEPQTSEISPGTTLNYGITLTCSYPYTGHLQYIVSNYTLVGSSSVSGAGAYMAVTCSGVCNFTVPVPIPSTVTPGYYSVAFQVIGLYWGGIVSMVGVGTGHTVGHKYAPQTSSTNSVVPTLSPTASHSKVSPSTTPSISTSISTSNSISKSISVSNSIGASHTATPTISISTSASIMPSFTPGGGSSQDSYETSAASPVTQSENTETSGSSSALSSWLF